MKRIVLLLIVVVFGVVGCGKKKYPESFSENAPVFYFKAMINSTPLELSAGVNNYRLYSSYTQDSNNVYRLIAELKSKDCSGACANSLKIQVNDYTVSAAGASMKIDSSLRVGSYGYVTSTTGTQYVVSFTSACNKTAETYFWDFGDGTTSTLANPMHVFKGSGSYQVSLQIKAVNGYVSNVCQTINLGTQGQLNAYVKVNGISGDSVKFDRVQSGGVSPMAYVWDFGDGTYSHVAAPVHRYRVSGSYPVSLKILDKDGNTVKTNYNIVTQRDFSSMAVNYSFFIMREMKNASLPSKITITYVDAQGLEYSSVNPNQPGSSNFEVLDVSNYDMNENNQSTKQLKIKFNCVVYHGSSSININNAEAVIAVAYK
jgi:PKD repeat protein